MPDIQHRCGMGSQRRHSVDKVVRVSKGELVPEDIGWWVHRRGRAGSNVGEMDVVEKSPFDETGCIEGLSWRFHRATD